MEIAQGRDCIIDNAESTILPNISLVGSSGSNPSIINSNGPTPPGVFERRAAPSVNIICYGTR
jgi:hypothetical protein